MKKLNPKQTRFVQEYLIDLNATQAAIRAGYSKKTARSIGQRLLTNVDIAAAISEAQKTIAERVGITLERWLNELSLIFFADMQNYVDVDTDTGAARAKGYDEMPEGASRVIHTIEENRSITEDEKGKQSLVFSKFKFKLHDKLKSGEMIGKHLGYLKEEVKHSGNINIGPSYEEVRKAIAAVEKET